MNEAIPTTGRGVGVLAAVLLLWGTAEATQTAEQKCDRKRFDAAANYVACQQKAVGRFAAGGYDMQDFGIASLGCTAKLADKWESFRKAAALAGTTCAGDRWVDGGTTVTDLLTGLEWEKKTTDPGAVPIRPTSTTSTTWRRGLGGAAAVGSIFTSFVPGLNAAGFAGQSDWRLPDYAELASIMTVESRRSAPVCSTPPCIPAVFGPTAMVPPTYLGGYWTATTATWSPTLAFFVDFRNGPINFLYFGGKAGAQSVRAVRGGW